MLDQAELDEFYNRLQHGLPLSVDEQRRLFTLVDGRDFPVKKRCTKCNAEGCIYCHWTGYATRC